MILQKEKQICLRIVKDRETFDLRTALEKYQDDYIAALLKSTPVRESDIPGVWPLVKQRLSSNGVPSAYEVCPDRLQSLKWLGEVPRQALLAWRATLEDAACTSMPHKLPEEQAARIRARYEALRRKIIEEIV